MKVALAAVGLLAVLGADAQTLKSLMAGKGRYMGAILETGYINDASYTNILKQEFEVITAENSMKWDATEGSRGNFNYNGGDQIVNFATSNGMKMRGHTLVWYSQLPNWVSNSGFNAATLTSVMENHITNVMGRWKGKLFHWDVCNELFNENGSHRSWVYANTVGGGTFPHQAFTKASQVDPSAKLYLNDYNIEYSGAKSTAVINLVKDMKSKGVKVDGIGSQCHMIVGQFPSSFQSNLAAQAAAAGEVAITELDIRTNTPASSAKLQQQKTDYQNVFAACLATNGCVGVSIWGVTDGRSWIPGVFSGEGDALPWNSSYQKKPAYDGIVAAINAASGGVTTTRTTTQQQTTTQGQCQVATVTVSSTVTRTGTVTVTVGGGQQTTTQQQQTTTQGNTGNCSSRYGQCGGQGWSGPTCCSQGTCTASNQYYSQCI